MDNKPNVEEPSVEQFADTLKEQLTEYIELRVDLFKASSVERLSKAAGQMITALVIMVLVFFIILFSSMVAGFYFSELFGSLLKGFGLVALGYFFLFIMVLLFRKKMIQIPVVNSIIAVMYDDDEA